MRTATLDCPPDSLPASEPNVASGDNRHPAHEHSLSPQLGAKRTLAGLTSQRSEIDLRTVALLLSHHIAGGTVVAKNSYRLIQAYTWDDELRTRIDNVVNEYHQRTESSYCNA